MLQQTSDSQNPWASSYHILGFDWNRAICLLNIGLPASLRDSLIDGKSRFIKWRLLVRILSLSFPVYECVKKKKKKKKGLIAIIPTRPISTLR